MISKIIQSQLKLKLHPHVPRLLNYIKAHKHQTSTRCLTAHHHHDQQNEHEHKTRWFGEPNSKKLGLGSALLASFIITHETTYTSNEPPNSGGNIPPNVEDLQHAILQGDERRVRMLVKKCSPDDINTRHRLGWQMLHVAAVNGYHRICEILLENGAKVNDTDLYNPMALAQQYNIDPLVIALIRDTEFNSGLPRMNYQGCTPLHYAALSNSLETIDVLKRYGANPTIKNALGHTAAKFANPRVSEDLSRYEREFVDRQKELEDEERRRYPLEQRIKDLIVGQETAISTVAANIRSKENGWFDEDHPLVFLFLGSSGIGKTELAKQVAKYLHKDQKNAFIRLDMSEYQEKHSVARMIGSPPGYVGYQDGGQLTEALRKCNNAVVLFDEVEKAHPDILTVLLQLFDEGRLTDSKGQTIDCKDAIFIMTSNLASEAIAEHATQLRAEQQAAQEVKIANRLLTGMKQSETNKHEEKITISRKFKDTIVRPILKRHLLRDEFLGRIDEMVYFLPFSDSELRQLVIKELRFWADIAMKKNSIEMTWDDKVVDVLCKGYDIHYGARSIKYEVKRRIVNQISELHHTLKKAKKVHISVKHNSDDGGQDLINIEIK